MTDYIIRDATEQDVLDIVLSVKQFCKEVPHPAWDKFDSNKVNELVSQLCQIDQGFVKIVEHDNEIVGSLIAVISSVPINSLVFAQELMFWLDPEHRNGKTSMKLIDSYVEWSQKMGCNFIRLSELDNILGSKAGALFKRKGFIPVETAYVKEI